MFLNYKISFGRSIFKINSKRIIESKYDIIKHLTSWKVKLWLTLTQGLQKKLFYITTPIYYPSGKLHIGNSPYTTIACDVLTLPLDGFWRVFIWQEQMSTVWKSSKKPMNSDFSNIRRWYGRRHGIDAWYFLRSLFGRMIILNHRGYVWAMWWIYDGWYSVSDEEYSQNHSLRKFIGMKTEWWLWESAKWSRGWAC